jgi:hypothetical protein
MGSSARENDASNLRTGKRHEPEEAGHLPSLRQVERLDLLHLRVFHGPEGAAEGRGMSYRKVARRGVRCPHGMEHL